MINATPSLAANRKGRINQSVCRWCYSKVPIDDLARESAKMGIKAMDLVAQEEWPAVKKYGLSLTVVPGPTSIPDGLNRKENHDAIEKKMATMIADAKAAGALSIILFSGNRKGMPDEQGIENTAIGLNRIKKMGEDTGVLIVMELLNSKVDHKDYMCDRTPWGVEVMKTRQLAYGETAVRHLPHANHGRRCHPHHPGQPPVHRPLPHGRRTRPA